MYFFFDEVQRVKNWEDSINSFRVDFNCDIYITGSNAYLLSSEYSTYLSGRCVEIKMLPLSFSEFLYFYNFEVRVGEVSKALEERIMSEEELEVLKAMHKAVAKADSLEQFEKLIFNL